MKLGGIYIYKEDTAETAEAFGMFIGKGQLSYYYPNDHISDLYEDVEVGGELDLKELPQHTFGIIHSKKEWHIKDNSKNGEEAIIAKGTYEDSNVEEQVRKLLKQIRGI